MTDEKFLVSKSDHITIRNRLKAKFPGMNTIVPAADLDAKLTAIKYSANEQALIIQWGDATVSIHPHTETTLNMVWPHYKRRFRKGFRSDRACKRSFYKDLRRDLVV